MTVSLDRERRGSFFDVLEQWRVARATETVDAVDVIAIEQFCVLAASLGKSSRVFDVMQDTVKRPSTPVEMHVSGTAFSCPWVIGPDAFSRPFGLDTKHGHLIFIFAHDSAIYQPFWREFGGAPQGGLLDRVDRAHREFRARAARCDRAPRADRQGVPPGHRGHGRFRHADPGAGGRYDLGVRARSGVFDVVNAADVDHHA
jgi:hypothetical protein